MFKVVKDSIHEAAKIATYRLLNLNTCKAQTSIGALQGGEHMWCHNCHLTSHAGRTGTARLL